jgi:hypothetical protein
MISNPDTARNVIQAMIEAMRQVEECCQLVGNNNVEEGRAFSRTLSPVMGTIAFDVLEPLFEGYPEFKPANWGE